MIEDILSRIRTIFVGREPELRRLEGLWNLACQDREHLAYALINAPGVGKTTLIHHFGKKLESDKEGLFIRFLCSSNFDSPENLNEELLYVIQENIQEKEELIKAFLKGRANQKQAELLKRNLIKIQERIEKKLSQSQISLNDVIFILKRLSNVIPIFFAADEIQEFQKLTFESSNSNGETALHYFTRLLKNLLNLKMLLILSGTRYHILSQIGTKIGSPIREKVESLIITNFTRSEMDEYVQRVKELINIAEIDQFQREIPGYIENFRQFLFAFSGGHPRTIERITMHFLSNFSYILKSDFREYAKFVGFLLPLSKSSFESTLLTKEKEEELVKLSSNDQFSIVKKWVIERSYSGLFLGSVPQEVKNSEVKEEVDDIVYNLMNLGFIVQNGMLNYYLTSYFHYLAFLKPYHDTHETFLKEVLHNKFFELMCGFHSGFGYTFENIFSASLLIYAQRVQKGLPLPLDTNLLKQKVILKEHIDWTSMSFRTNIIYQTPLARAIDAIIFQEGHLFLMQFTTSRNPDSSKIEALNSQLNEIRDTNLESGNISHFLGWIVSLYDFSSKTLKREDLLITSGESLIPILGEELYIRLRKVKEAFSGKP